MIFLLFLLQAAQGAAKGVQSSPLWQSQQAQRLDTWGSGAFLPPARGGGGRESKHAAVPHLLLALLLLLESWTLRRTPVLGRFSPGRAPWIPGNETSPGTKAFLGCHLGLQPGVILYLS